MKTPPKMPPEENGSRSSVTLDEPITVLKSIVLTIDWEIDDDILARFIRQVELLKTGYGESDPELRLIDILGGLGRYLRQRREKADPDVLNLLSHACEALERLSTATDVPETEKIDIVNRAVGRYTSLSEKVAQRAHHLPVLGGADRSYG